MDDLLKKGGCQDAFVGYRFQDGDYCAVICPKCKDAPSTRMEWREWRIVESLCQKHAYEFQCKRMGEQSD